MKLIPEQSGYNIVQIYEHHVRIYRCHCYYQDCKGRYIKSRVGQKQCLLSLSPEQFKTLIPLWNLKKKSPHTSMIIGNGSMPAIFTGVNIVRNTQNTTTQEDLIYTQHTTDIYLEDIDFS